MQGAGSGNREPETEFCQQLACISSLPSGVCDPKGEPNDPVRHGNTFFTFMSPKCDKESLLILSVRISMAKHCSHENPGAILGEEQGFPCREGLSR